MFSDYDLWKLRSPDDDRVDDGCHDCGRWTENCRCEDTPEMVEPDPAELFELWAQMPTADPRQ